MPLSCQPYLNQGAKLPPIFKIYSWHTHGSIHKVRTHWGRGWGLPHHLSMFVCLTDPLDVPRSFWWQSLQPVSEYTYMCPEADWIHCLSHAGHITGKARCRVTPSFVLEKLLGTQRRRKVTLEAEWSYSFGSTQDKVRIGPRLHYVGRLHRTMHWPWDWN